MKLNEELAIWLADLREQWSGKIEKPLGGCWIFSCYLLGAFTLFFFVVLLAPEAATSNIRETLGVTFPLIASLPVAVPIAGLLSWPRRPYTPARMYLGGLAFSALVCLIVLNVVGQLEP